MPLYLSNPSSDQSVIQVRRSTDFALSSEFLDIEFDKTDVENTTAVLLHNSTYPEQIDIKIPGNYLVNYSFTSPAGTDSVYARALKNGVTELSGSWRQTTPGGDAENISNQFIAPLTANEYFTLQAKCSIDGPSILSGMVMTVVHLAGQKGEKGSASATDIDAIHLSTGGEISTATEKTSAAIDDLLVIEDSAESFNKKKFKIGNLPGGVSLSDVAPANVDSSVAGAGAASAASRQDHKHNISTGTPTAAAVVAGNTVNAGSASTLAKSDHQHAVAVATPASVGTANAAGSLGTFVRSDHVHAGLTRGAGDFNLFTGKTTPSQSDLLLIEDSDAANAKKKITIASIIDTGGVFSTVQTNSAGWESTEATVVGSSAAWNDTRSTLIANSGIWNNVDAVVVAGSAKWDSDFSTMSANSANWDASRSTVLSNSANWDATRSTVLSNSGIWNNVDAVVVAGSAKWDSNFATMSANSGIWNNVDAVIVAGSAKWDSSFSTMSANSGTWNQTHSTLLANSGIWNSIDSVVVAGSAKWNSDFSTVSANSGNWNSAYSLKTTLDGLNGIISGNLGGYAAVTLITPKAVIKTADQSWTSDTALADVGQFSFTVAANKTYYYLFMLDTQSHNTPDWKFSIVSPASPNGLTILSLDTTIVKAGGAATPQTVTTVSVNARVPVVLHGNLYNGANAGTLKLQAAQNSSNGATITIYKGSIGLLWECGTP